MSKENAGANQTHHCCHCLEHCKTSFAPLRDTRRRQPCTVKKIPSCSQIIPLHRWFCATGVSKPGRRRARKARKSRANQRLTNAALHSSSQTVSPFPPCSGCVIFVRRCGGGLDRREVP